MKKKNQERIVCLNTEKDTVHLKSLKSGFYIMAVSGSFSQISYLQHAQKEEHGNQIQLVSPFSKTMYTDF